MEEGGTESKYETCLEFQQGRSGEENIPGEGNALIRGLKMEEIQFSCRLNYLSHSGDKTGRIHMAIVEIFIGVWLFLCVLKPIPIKYLNFVNAVIMVFYSFPRSLQLAKNLSFISS